MLSQLPSDIFSGGFQNVAKILQIVSVLFRPPSAMLQFLKWSIYYESKTSIWASKTVGCGLALFLVRLKVVIFGTRFPLFGMEIMVQISTLQMKDVFYFGKELTLSKLRFIFSPSYIHQRLSSFYRSTSEYIYIYR